MEMLPGKKNPLMVDAIISFAHSQVQLFMLKANIIITCPCLAWKQALLNCRMKIRNCCRKMAYNSCCCCLMMSGVNYQKQVQAYSKSA